MTKCGKFANDQRIRTALFIVIIADDLDEVTFVMVNAKASGLISFNELFNSKTELLVDNRCYETLTQSGNFNELLKRMAFS